MAEASAAHEGDKAALLAAINEAAGQLSSNRSKAPSSKQAQGKQLMQGSKVNATVARDLVSNAGSTRADDLTSAADFERGKARLSRPGDQHEIESDLRSLPSEYDYGSKRKFLDVLGNVSIS